MAVASDEAPTRELRGAPRAVSRTLAVALSLYALYWVLFIVQPQIYRVSFLLVALVPFGYLLSTGSVDWGPVRQVVERVGTRVLRAAGAPGRDGLDPNAPRPESVEEAA